MTLRQQRGREILGTLVDRKTARLPYARPGRVEGRNSDGTTRLRYLGGTCVVRSGISEARRGEVISAAPAEVRGRGAGSAGVALGAGSGAGAGMGEDGLFVEAAARPWVEHVVLDELCAGEEVTVNVLGRGFTEATRFDFLLEDGRTIHPDLEIRARRFIDAGRVELEVRLEEELLRLPLAYGEESR